MKNFLKDITKSSSALTIMINWPLFFILIGLQLVSCGKKNQIVRQEAPANPDINNPANNGQLQNSGIVNHAIPDPTLNQEYARLFTGHACPTNPNSPRIQMQTFVPINQNNLSASAIVNSSNATTTIPSTGTVTKIFAGKTVRYNDLLIIKEISNNGKISGHVITLSFCQQDPILLPNRPITGIAMRTTLPLLNNNGCNIGNVNGQFSVSIGPYANTLSARTFPVSFYGITTCN